MEFSTKSDLVCSVPNYQTNLLIEYQDENKVCKYRYNPKDDSVFNSLIGLEVNGEYYAKEIIMNGVKRKPYVLVEKLYKNYTSFQNGYDDVIKKLCRDIVKIFKINYDIIIKRSDILILDGSHEVNSMHKMYTYLIVSPNDKIYYYTNSKYTNSSTYHIYTSLINVDETYNEILSLDYFYDVKLPIIYSSIGDGLSIIKPIDPETYNELVLSNTQKMKYVVSFIDETKTCVKLNTPIINQTINTTIPLQNKPNLSSDNVKILEIVKKYHPSAYFINYENNYYNFDYTNTNELCIATNQKHNNIHGFSCYFVNTKLYAKCYSKKCEYSKHIGFIDDVDEFINNSIQINKKYLSECKIITDMIDNWQTNKQQHILAIKSPMGTGKTTLIKELVKNDHFKKILWITHRQSLTKSIHGTFKKYDFDNYMDYGGCLYNKKRLIVQVDSLNRITKGDYIDGTTEFNIYDLVIIDEIEGTLQQYNSPYLVNKLPRQLFNLMLNVLKYSKKILLLDANMNTRTKLLIAEFDNAIIVNNKFMPIQKTFRINTCKITFNKKLIDDITCGLNVCVVSMSIDYLEILSIELQKMNIKYVMHTSKTDDKLKDELENVNVFWKQFNVVLYSPTIESGIDFSEKHFDRIYGIIIDGPLTCSQRSFLQMIGRIRHVESSIITCLYQRLSDDMLTDSYYTFNDLLCYYRYYETLNGKRILHDNLHEEIVNKNSVVMVRKKSDITLFDKIVLHNETENLNKSHSIFAYILQKLIIQSGHLIEFVNDKILKIYSTDKSKNTVIKQLIDVNEYDYDINYLEQQEKRSNLTKHEKIVLRKLRFKITFAIPDNITNEKMKEYMEMYIGKEQILKQFKLLFGYEKLNDQNIDSDQYDVGKEKSRQKIVIQLINILTGNNYASLKIKYFDNLIIEHDDYIAAQKKILSKSQFFKNINKCHSLFFQNNYKYKINKSNMRVTCSAIVIAILKKYNIILARGKSSKVGGVRKYKYSLSIGEEMMSVIERQKMLKC